MNVHFDNPNVWRWFTTLLVAFIIGIWTGQFTPNRNIVTADQWFRWQSQSAAQVASVQASVVSLAATVETLNDEVSELRGELRGKNMLAPDK